jgi:hypothetical protein
VDSGEQGGNDHGEDLTRLINALIPKSARSIETSGYQLIQMTSESGFSSKHQRVAHRMPLTRWLRASRIERIAYLVGFALIVSGLTHLLILIGTGASWYGPLSWRKPMTFGLSFGMTLVTVVWVATFLDIRPRTRARLIGAFTAACAFETALVTLQAWRHVPSHFNFETTFDAIVARSLAVGGLLLVVTIVALTLIAFRSRSTAPSSIVFAIRAGLGALVGAQIAGAVMIAMGVRFVVAGDPQAAYATGGALKLTHFAMMHGVLLLPGLAWMLSLVNWTERRRLAIVLVGTGGYVLLAASAILRNLGELRLVQLPMVSDALLAIGASTFLAACMITVFGMIYSTRFNRAVPTRVESRL